jgi:hypothetical protein
MSNIYFKMVQYQSSDHTDLFIAYRILHAYACYDLDEYGVLGSVCRTTLAMGLKLLQEHNKKHHMIEIRRGSFFYNNYWGIDGKYMLFSNNTRDQIERIHFEVRIGNKEKAELILNSIHEDELSQFELGYYFFYKGLVLDNIDMFFNSIKAFRKIEDKFAANMARLELYRRGEPAAIIEAAYS